MVGGARRQGRLWNDSKVAMLIAFEVTTPHEFS